MTAQENIGAKIPDFRPGDTIRVHVKVMEGESERLQVFEGIVMRRRGRGMSETFIVRKISFGVGVERSFPVHSPHLARIEIVKSSKVRRSRLYYLRALSGKAARLADQAPAGSSPVAPAVAPTRAHGAAASPAKSDGSVPPPAPKAEAKVP